ncbi:MAG: cytochrome c [Pseudomonadota bacterium]|nr:cytochrome c [Pseudomonadota bacterium]
MTKFIKLLWIVALAAFAGQALASGNAEAGKAKFEATCAACHGSGGHSTNDMFPVLAGQHASYIVHALHAYQAGTRHNPIMRGMAAGLSDQDILNIAAYLSGQTELVTKY